MLTKLRILEMEPEGWLIKIFTARKRSLGQGNVFTPVCLFTGGGVVLRGVLSVGDVVLSGDV